MVYCLYSLEERFQTDTVVRTFRRLSISEVVFSAFGFTTSHHTHSIKGAMRFGHDRACMLTPAFVREIDNNPISSTFQLMSQGGIGKERCI